MLCIILYTYDTKTITIIYIYIYIQFYNIQLLYILNTNIAYL